MIHHDSLQLFMQFSLAKCELLKVLLMLGAILPHMYRRSQGSSRLAMALAPRSGWGLSGDQQRAAPNSGGLASTGGVLFEAWQAMG